MKMQIKNSHRATIGITFLATLLIMAACYERKVPIQNTAASQTRAKPPKIDIHTAVMTGNLEALTQPIAAGSNLNEKDPLGNLSPLVNASLFGYIYGVLHFF